MNDKKITFRKESVQTDQNELFKELMNKLNRTEDKQNMTWLLERIFQSEVQILDNFQKFAIQIIKEAIKFHEESIEAYRKKYESNLFRVIFHPERIEQRAAESALEDTKKMIATISAIGNPLIQGISETRMNSVRELSRALVNLLEQRPEALESLRYLTIQGTGQ